MSRPFATFAHPAIAAGLVFAAASACQARPEYARKEMKPCGYCHVNPAGGGARNPRGVYYAVHNHTFTGYDEATVMGASPAKSGPPSYHSAWKIAAPASSRRIAVADVTDDKTPRVLLLDDHTSVGVYRIADGKLAKEDEVDLGDGAPKFVAGHFAKGKPAVIAAPGVVAFRSGDHFVKKPAPDVNDVTGMARFTDGAEAFFFFAGGQPDSWAVDTSAEKPIIAGHEIGDPSTEGVYKDITIHPPVEVMKLLGVPDQGQKAGVTGLYCARAEGKLYSFVPWQDADGSWSLHVADAAALHPDGGGDFKAIWTSPKLAGRVLDVALGADPSKPGPTGFYVLEATGDGGAERTVEYFALD